MPSRHILRSIVLQSLYESDFNYYIEDFKEELLNKVIQNNLKSFSGSSLFFARQLYMGVLENKTKIDDFINQYSPKISINNLSIIDRNILRIGLYEILYSTNKQKNRNEEIPPKVIINEAVELAKKYSGEGAKKFINGVLASALLLKENGKEKKLN